MSFSTESKFENLRCELIIYEDLKVVRDEVSKPRKTRDTFHEFCILVIILLLACFAIYSASFQNRMSFFITKTFSIKASAYQFTNTNFFARPNFYMILIVCLTISFEIIYINEKTEFMISTNPIGLDGYVITWLVTALWIGLFFMLKRILVQAIAGLFQMRKLRDWQLFDLVNFSGYFALILFIVILWDFIIKSQGESWINSYFSYYFILVLMLFALWFIVKFVINSSYQKLLIISYLCATEIIPSILIMVWFFK